MSDPDNHSPHEMNDDPDDTQVMTTYAQSEDEYDDDYQDFDDEGGLPSRPRRVLVNRWSALLAAVVIAGACFYAGVRVEKSKVSSTSTSSGFAALASRFAGTSARASGASATSGRAGATGATGGGGFGAGAGADGFGARAGGGTSGTISSIDGDTLYISETGGNTVKVDLSDTTTLTKTETVSKSKLFPGDTVSVAGTAGSSGAIKATSVTDSGSGSGTSSTGSTGSSGSTSSSSSGSSALNSLFGG